MSASRRRTSLLTVLVLLASLMPVGLILPAVADEPTPGEIVISQVYGGGGNAGSTYTHDFVELFNRGGTPVNVSGWSVQYASAAGSTWNVTVLSGTIAPGQYFLVQQAQGSGGTAALPTPDATGTANMSATNGKVALSDTSTALSGTCPEAVDFVGFGSANCFEGSAATPVLTNTTAALRSGEGCVDTDDNASDFTTGAPTPRNSASPTVDCGDSDPDPDPEPRHCPEPDQVSPISMIQGTGETSPCVDELVTIVGVVVGDYQGTSAQGALRGYYVQSRDADQDDDPATSEGIFVFNFDNVDVSLGDLVRVTGVVAEFQGQTQLGFPQSSEVLESGWTVTPADVALPVPSADYLERYEGMLVRFPQTLYVTEFFQLGRFGQIVVSSEARLAQPTNVVAPGTEANALQAANNLNRLIIDDHLNNQNPDPIVLGRGGNELTAANTLRGGDTVAGAVGVLTYGWAGNAASGNAYRLRVVGDLSDTGLVPGGVVPDFQAANPRPSAVPEVGGSLSVVSFNVLNYFLTLNVPGNTCGPVGFEQACRGANSSDELARQRVKLLEALAKLDADVIALMELENTPGVEPAADLAAGMNALIGEDLYTYVDTGAFGTDVIRTGLIYRHTTVSEAGAVATLDSSVDPRFDDSLNRPALAQSFEDLGSGETFTVVINHLKSKGSCPSSGPNSDQGDGQSCWNAARTSAAEAMVDWLAEYPTGVVDDDVLITGDLNSYAKEDPIQVFVDAGYINLAEHFEGEDAYGYVFDGQWGYLDHALASASLFEQVTGTASYHINSDEPSVLDYNVEFKSANQLNILFAPDEFRTSDHDPVVIGLSLGTTGGPGPDPWDPSTVYNTGDRVTYDGKVFEASWWTQGQVPGASPYGPWQEMAETPDGTAIWTASRIFNTGDIVVHNGKTYRAKWWTRNQEPGDPWGPWEELAEDAEGTTIWTPSGVFNTGDQVLYDGRLFEALWWTQNQVPGANPNGAWQEIAETPDGTAIWTPSRVFNTGDIVSHNGSLYRAKWWNRNVTPTGSGPWQAISP